MQTQRITKRHIGRFIRKYNKTCCAGQALQMLQNLKSNPALHHAVHKNWR